MLKYLLGAVAGFVICGVLFLCLEKKSPKEKMGYVITQKVFEKYQGAIEMNAKMKKEQDSKNLFLDSLRLDLSVTEAKAGKESLLFTKKKESYAKIYEQMVKSNQYKVQETKDGVWKQINQYISEYGKEKGYRFILGATGDGNLMYADSTADLTNEIIIYANKKYSGE